MQWIYQKWRQGRAKLPVLLSMLLIVAGFSGLLMQPEGPLAGLEWRAYDAWQRLHGELPGSEQVVIVTIDEQSLVELGHWPWDRRRLAQVVERLSAAGARLILFDILFPEATPGDQEFATAIAESGRVILPLAFHFDRKSEPLWEPALLNAAYWRIERSEYFAQAAPITASGLLPPTLTLLEAALSLGSVQIFPDQDGVLRWEPLVIGYETELYPSAALIGAACYLGYSMDDVVLVAGEGVRLGEQRFLPTDPWGRTLIPYYGGNRTFTYLSVADLLAGRLDPALLEGRLVLVGATALGLYDLVVTPHSAALPGVEKHATMISAILEGRTREPLPDALNLLLLLLVGLLYTLTALLLRARGAFISGLLLMGMVGVIGYVGLLYGVAIQTVHTLAMLLTAFVVVTTVKYLLEERQAGAIRSLFSSYVTARVVEALIRDPSSAKLGGSRKQVTVLFSDIRGFTAFSERHSPEEVVTRLNEYLEEMTDAVFHFEGTLDKYIGDAIMAFWGAPLAQANQAELAVECGLMMLQRLEQLNRRWQHARVPIPPLEIGIGINSGEVLVGNIGAEGKKMEYTVIGDPVNLASRTEGLNKEFGCRLLITHYTLEQLPPERLANYQVTEYGEVAVKGREHLVRFYGIERREREEHEPELW